MAMKNGNGILKGPMKKGDLKQGQPAGQPSKSAPDPLGYTKK
jgi:hypothetical protein